MLNVRSLPGQLLIFLVDKLTAFLKMYQVHAERDFHVAYCSKMRHLCVFWGRVVLLDYSLFQGTMIMLSDIQSY